MLNEVAICNLALIALGEKEINALAEDSKAARLCNQWYAPVRDMVLRAHPWNCAIKRIRLAQLEAEPAFEYGYQYQLPGDCLRVLRMSRTDYEYKVEGRVLLTDQGEAYILYIRRETDSTKFDALLVSAIAARLAAELAVPLSGNRSLAETMWQAYSMKLSEAREVDGQEGTPDELEANEWLEARL